MLPHFNRLAASFGVDLSSPAIGLRKQELETNRDAASPADWKAATDDAAACAASRASSLTFDQTNQHGPTTSDHAADRHAVCRSRVPFVNSLFAHSFCEFIIRAFLLRILFCHIATQAHAVGILGYSHVQAKGAGSRWRFVHERV
jgi:hypothetical protein